MNDLDNLRLTVNRNRLQRIPLLQKILSSISKAVVISICLQLLLELIEQNCGSDVEDYWAFNHIKKMQDANQGNLDQEWLDSVSWKYDTTLDKGVSRALANLRALIIQSTPWEERSGLAAEAISIIIGTDINEYIKKHYKITDLSKEKDVKKRMKIHAEENIRIRNTEVILLYERKQWMKFIDKLAKLKTST